MIEGLMATDGSVGTYYGPEGMLSRGLTALGNMAGHLLVFMIYLSAALFMDRSSFGEFYYLLAVSLLTAAFITAGLPRFVPRLCARKRWRTARGRSELFLNSTLIAILLYVLVIPLLLLTHPGEILPGMVVIRYSVPMLYAGVIVGRFRRRKVLAAFILRNALILIGILLVVLFWRLDSNTGLLAVVFFGWFATFGLEFLWRPGISFWPSFLSVKRSLWLLRMSIPYWMRSVSSGLFIAGPPIVLGWSAGYHEVAVYGLAFTYVLLMGVVPSALISMGVPLVMNAHGNKWRRLLPLMGGILVNCALFILAIVLLGDRLLDMVVGPTHVPWLLPALALGTTFRWLRKPLSTLWSVRGLSPWHAIDVQIGAVVLLVVMAFGLLVGPTVEWMAFSYLAGWTATLTVTLSLALLDARGRGGVFGDSAEAVGGV